VSSWQWVYLAIGSITSLVVIHAAYSDEHRQRDTAFAYVVSEALVTTLVWPLAWSVMLLHWASNKLGK
jgi:hypothetical protein